MLANIRTTLYNVVSFLLVATLSYIFIGPQKVNEAIAAGIVCSIQLGAGLINALFICVWIAIIAVFFGSGTAAIITATYLKRQSSRTWVFIIESVIAGLNIVAALVFFPPHSRPYSLLVLCNTTWLVMCFLWIVWLIACQKLTFVRVPIQRMDA